MSIKSVMPSNHLSLCRSLLLLPSIFPNIRIFSKDSVLWHQVAKVLERGVKQADFVSGGFPLWHWVGDWGRGTGEAVLKSTRLQVAQW